MTVNEPWTIQSSILLGNQHRTLHIVRRSTTDLIFHWFDHLPMHHEYSLRCHLTIGWLALIVSLSDIICQWQGNTQWSTEWLKMHSQMPQPGIIRYLNIKLLELKFSNLQRHIFEGGFGGLFGKGTTLCMGKKQFSNLPSPKGVG